MKPLELLQMMQLADSALPLGGFAFSNGLEWMVKTGAIESLSSLESYLKGLIHQAAHFDLPFLKGFTGENPRESLEEYNQMLYMPPQRDFSITQGRAWLRLLPQIYREYPAGEMRLQLREWEIPPHFLYLLGRTLQERGYPRDSLAALYLFMLLRDQISAALRLGICGPALSQQLLNRCLPWVEQAMEESKDRDFTEAVRTSVILDISQAGHKSLYSKLFQN